MQYIDNEVDMIMNDLNTLPSNKLDVTMNGLVAGLVNCQRNISKTQGKTVKSVENHSRNQVEAILIELEVMSLEWSNGMRRLEG